MKYHFTPIKTKQIDVDKVRKQRNSMPFLQECKISADNAENIKMIP